ncbi:uncharacterized protein EKO05_0009097 [Ascochyta rabiei]|uniref:Uncharacterized protein n=1 Tax=Didymella rabiei TaxID=5454 RepID=A0A163IUS3_DIDRA|nr:uncharacterized protein EKO05_0009097 [Ascochyta rabiei]KZM25961.1 hypothetical protein ST47_g2892 [Ascochyta rabiei]UPX18807.1 hypothetical protein EKO05_0009097 [Ascochyta rabiei]
MPFKDIVSEVRRSILCCVGRDRKRPLDIGSPTNVRHINVSDTLPGLTDTERKHIREKVSNDAIRLLSLQSHPPSHPPSQPTTSPPSPEHSLRHEPSSVVSSQEPSMALLNAASKNLPDAVPTPPPQAHPHTSSPSARMKGMWDDVKRLSNSSNCRDSLYSKIEDSSINSEKQLKDSSSMTLNLELGTESPSSNTRSDSLRTLSLTSGFETQDTIGGHTQTAAPIASTKKVNAAIKEKETIDSSDEDEDPFIAAEAELLKKL